MSASSNVDHQEISHFDRMARLWWDPDGKMGQLHVINPLRLDYITTQVQLDQRRVVDIGCGGGILAEAMARSGARVTGVDLSQLSLDIARQHADQNGLAIDYRSASAEDLARDEAGRFDVVTCMEMLEHVPEPARVIAACAALLKPGGTAFFSTINRTPKAFLFAIIGGEYILGLLPRGTHRYRMLIKPSELRQWAGDSGLAFRSVASLMYNPLLRRFRVAPGREDINYMACYTKPEG